METQAAICLIAVPQAKRFPRPVLVDPLLRGDQLAADPGKLTGQMKTYAGVDARDQKLVGTKTGHEGRCMGVFGAGGRATIRLREPKGHGRLPVTKVDFLRSDPWLFDGGLQLTVEFQLGNF